MTMAPPRPSALRNERRVGASNSCSARSTTTVRSSDIHVTSPHRPVGLPRLGRSEARHGHLPMTGGSALYGPIWSRFHEQTARLFDSGPIDAHWRRGGSPAADGAPAVSSSAVYSCRRRFTMSERTELGVLEP